MNTNESHLSLNDTVITNGFCVGCGACAVPEESPFKIVMDEYGQYQARLEDSEAFTKTGVNYEELCPFGSISLNEDEIAKQHFAETCKHNSQAGYYNNVYVGHVAEGEFRQHGSSGGMGTWVLNELLAKGLVDHIVHVKSGGSDDLNNTLFKYSISNTLEETQKGGKSRYYPIELSEVLKTIRDQPGRYAVVGLPCFIKSIRLLQEQEPVLKERIHYCIGLVCGHLKSAHYAESLAWQMGIAPSDLKAIDFRIKDPSQPANRYSTYTKGRAGGKSMPTNQLFGTDWGAGTFKYKACDFCDDVFAETADVVLGDAWLPEYVHDSQGTNVVVTRNKDIEQLVTNARNEERLVLDNQSIEKAVESQDAGLRHRKIAIGYRLHRENRDNTWVPEKRTAQSTRLAPRYEMKRQELRSEIRCLSHTSFLDAKQSNNLSIYFNTVQPVYVRYSLQGRPFLHRLLSFIKRRLKTLEGYYPR